MAAVLVGASDPEGVCLSVPDIYEMPRFIAGEF